VRRNGARAFLTGLGMAPQREHEASASELPRWRVPGWTLHFGDSELIALAERYGWEG
jgi:hypothetical protein